MDTNQQNYDYISNMAEQMYLSLVGPEYMDIRSVCTQWLDKSGDILSLTMSKT
jgi:hypothetical protein